MTITYTWEITGLKTTNIGELENTVVQTYWKKIGTDENGNTGTFSGATPFTRDPNDESGPKFIPFENLTEEDVLSWIKTIVVGDYETHVNEQIQKQINEKINPIVDAKMPWAPAVVTPPVPAPAAETPVSEPTQTP